MADLINNDLGKILQIVSEENHQAIYKPATDAYGNYLPKPNQCFMPDLLNISLDLTLPVLEPIKECDLNFIPYPIVPPFFIPDDLTSPCGDGMGVEMVYTSLTGQSVTLPSSAPLTEIPFVGVSPLAVIPIATSQPLPNLVVHIPVTVTSGNATITAGERYRVSLKVAGTPIPDGDIVSYLGKSYTAGQYFYGKISSATASLPSGNASVLKLTLDQTRRITEVLASKVKVASAFSVTGLSGLEFTLNRFVVSVDDTRPIDSDIRFEQVDQYGCQYRLLGELNLNTPCPDGYAFDTQYQSTASEYVVATKNGAQTLSTISNYSSNTVTSFKDLIPHEVGQPLPMFELQTAAVSSGQLDPGKLYKVLGTSGSYITKNSAKIYAGSYFTGSSDTFTTSGDAVVYRTYQNYVISVDTVNDTVTVSTEPYNDLPTTAGLPSSSSNKWLINRFVVRTADGPSTFLYVKDADNSCAGKLIGDINVPQITQPCGETGYTIGVANTLNFNYQYTDANIYDAAVSTGKTAAGITSSLEQSSDLIKAGFTTSKDQTHISPTANNTNTCCLTLDMPTLNIYPYIPEILAGVNIQIVKGYLHNKPVILITGTGSGSPSPDSVSCANCCLWA